MIHAICIIVRKPEGEERSTLGIRTAWATHAGAFDTKILFIEDGLYNLLDNPGYNTETLKTFMKENGATFAVRSHLEERGVSEEFLLEGVQIVSEEEVAELIRGCDAFATF